MNVLIQRLVQDLTDADEALKGITAMNITLRHEPNMVTGAAWVLSAQPAISGALSRLGQILTVHKELQDIINPNDFLATIETLRDKSTQIDETITKIQAGEFQTMEDGESLDEYLNKVLNDLHDACQSIHATFMSMQGDK